MEYIEFTVSANQLLTRVTQPVRPPKRTAYEQQNNEELLENLTF